MRSTATTGAIGAIAVAGDADANPFTDEDVALLRLVGANLSTAVRLFRANRSREVSERLTSIGQLLSQVIHDFKTPMTVISGYVQLMSEADELEQRAEYAEEILQQFDILTSMQREVLEFARGERNIFIRRVYLKKFFADLTRQLGHEVDGRAIELELDVDTKVVARFDENRVARAIHNLARNAVEAMVERGGRLTIKAGMEEQDLVIRVCDTGPGIPPRDRGPTFSVFRHRREERRYGPRFGHREEDRRGAWRKRVRPQLSGRLRVRAATTPGRRQAARGFRSGRCARTAWERRRALERQERLMPSKLPLLDERSRSLETCGYCPKLCRAACPVSAAEPRDSLTPWGKMSLAWFASRGDVEPDAELALTAWACTGCFACRDRCDHRNEVAHTLGAARADFRAIGLAPAASVRVVDGYAEQGRALSSAIDLLRKEPGVREDSPTALLVGCQYAREHGAEARAGIAVTRRLFGSVRLIDGCCGYPLLMAGDRAGFESSLSRMRAAAAGSARFVALDPGCALVLQPQGAKTLIELAASHLDAFKRVSRYARGPVRWHDPCKLGRGLGQYEAPRTLLGCVLGRAPDELERRRDACTCSGAGGLLPVTMPEVSRQIAREKLREHASAGGGLLVTACASSLRRLRGEGGEVVDLVDVARRELPTARWLTPSRRSDDAPSPPACSSPTPS